MGQSEQFCAYTKETIAKVPFSRLLHGVCGLEGCGEVECASFKGPWMRHVSCGSDENIVS